VKSGISENENEVHLIHMKVSGAEMDDERTLVEMGYRQDLVT